MAVTQTETDLVHSPSSLVGIFSNTLNNEATRKLFSIKGVYNQGKGIPYSGFYYDSLKDENSDASITIVVPASLRAKLSPNKTIECIGYLTKRVQSVGARVDLLVNVTNILSQGDIKYSDEQLKGFEILQKKAEIAYKDVDSFIRSKIINGEPITVNILIGKSGIIESDIKHQLQEAISFYKFYFIKINLSSEREISDSLNFYSKKCDILVVARGGGDNMEIFDKPEIAETALSLNCFFVTAIGHEANVSLLQKVADKPFITPTSLGEYFKTIYNATVEQLQNSKVKLVEDISKQFKANYEKQIETLNEQIKNLGQVNEKGIENTKVLNEKEVALLNTQIKELKEQHQYKLAEVEDLQKKVKTSTSIVLTIVLIVVAVIVGFVIGKLI